MCNKEQPLVSVVVPVYNVEKYLDKCMYSIVNQTYQNLEIILIDDGSKDRSGDLCDIWSQKDQRIKVIHKENGGLSSARNVGIEIIEGKYIMFVDSDDILSETIVQTLYDIIVNKNSDIAICDTVHIFQDKNYEFENNNNIMVFTPEDAIKEMWYQKSFLPSAWGKLYKTELFKQIRFTENRLFEDIDIMHEIFWRSNRIAFSNAKLYGYVHRDKSITNQKFSKRDTDILIIADKIIAFADEHSEKIKGAANAYATVAALRVYLNAPREKSFVSDIEKSKEYLKIYGKMVLKDSNIRKKHKYGLLLYFYFNPIIRCVYSKVNRWR